MRKFLEVYLPLIVIVVSVIALVVTLSGCTPKHDPCRPDPCVVPASPASR